MSPHKKKFIALLLLFFVASFVFVGTPNTAKAFWPTIDFPTLVENIYNKYKDVFDKIRAGIAATSFKGALSTFLNKLAYDSAVYISAGGSGQKSLINPFSKDALQNLADATAGQLIDEFATGAGLVGGPCKPGEDPKACKERQSRSGFGTASLCEPVDLTTKANLLLSFKKPKEPPVPKCSLTKIKQAAKKSAEDNLLEASATLSITEGDSKLTSQSVTADQALNGSNIQIQLTTSAAPPAVFGIAPLIEDRVLQYSDLVKEISERAVQKKQGAENYLPALKELESDLGNAVSELDGILDKANKCLTFYDQVNGIAACIPGTDCYDFYTITAPTQCNKAASQSILYSSQLLGIAAKTQDSVNNLISHIEVGAFNNVATDDAKDLANIFNPEQSDLGQVILIGSRLSEEQQKRVEEEKLKQLASGPCKGLETTISGNVVTPASAACDTLNQALGKSTKAVETFTGQPIADAFGIFVNTLSAKLLEQFFKKGLNYALSGKQIGDGLRGEDVLTSGASLGGKKAAEQALGGLLTASLTTGGQQDILSILASCPPQQAALNNCIIDEAFRRAVEKQYTVQEAMDAYKKSGGAEGLDSDKPFGYIVVGGALDEPDFKNGYPYRSMLYLRKYRIIPVGWELAAQYIKNIETPKTVHTLGKIVEGFSDPTSPFFGLVDPAWVLKSPQVFCAKQGPGPEIISSEIACEQFDSSATGNGRCLGDDYRAQKIGRQDWCADEQTCLEEGENGDCKRYGYCALEKAVWKLGGTQCKEQYATCESYKNSITKTNYDLLENTLLTNGCSGSVAGCQWYCQDAPKLCIGGTRSGQACSTNNDCASIYCDTSLAAPTCVNGDLAGSACTTNSQCGNGVVDGSCEEGGVWSCKADSLPIADWDMESGDVLSWDQGASEGCFDAASYSKSTSVVHSGTRSLQINSTGSANPADYCQGSGQTVTLEVGKTYTLEAWVRSEGGPSNGVIYNPMGPTSFAFYSINPTSEWQLVSRTFSATNTSMSFGFRIPQPGTTAVYVDDVRLYEGDRVHFDRDVKKCDGKDAGCTEFLKVIPGTNLIGNSGFEDDADLNPSPLSIPFALPGYAYANRWFLNNNTGSAMNAEINHTVTHSGKNSLLLRMDPDTPPPSSGLRLRVDDTVATPTPSAVPTNFKINPEKTYTASVWVNVPDGFASISFGNATTDFWTNARSTTNQWERLTVSMTATDVAAIQPNEIRVWAGDGGPPGTQVYIDDLQLEEGDTASDYKQYGSSNQVNLNGKRILCEEKENGCKLYTATSGGDGIPAVAKVADQCPAECKGYKQYEELPSFFAPTGGIFPSLIPSTAKQCSASQVGCEEFTNLDIVASGGEARQYFTQIRQCAKPGTTLEATFYTWEGSDEAGFQLKAWQLKKYSDGSPFVTTSTIPPLDCSLSNPDCRTFYTTAGAVSLRELSKTVFISDDCHPLRRTLQGTWDDCRNSGGRTDVASPAPTDIVTCFYDAIPSQGVVCGAQFAGCREYRGPSGNNFRTAFTSDFEDLTSQGWTPSNLSSESTTVGGRSYRLPANSSMGKPVADSVVQDKTYILEFWAKSTVPGITVNAKFLGTLAVDLFFQTTGVSISDSWNKYSLGPRVFDRPPVVTDETLQILSNGAVGEYVYIDNITLREITDNPFLIKDSWKTPLSCDVDDLTGVNGIPGGTATTRMLGCEEYRDSQNAKVYLKSFTSLCREDRVGCTEMFDTKNSRSMYDQVIKGESISRDTRELIVDDPKKYCGSEAKGCEKLGLPVVGTNQSVKSWSETYLINNPDQYDTIACTADQVMCSEFVTRGGGTVYFKDPGETRCEYQESINIGGTVTKGWFKRGVVPSSAAGLVPVGKCSNAPTQVCSTNLNCGGGANVCNLDSFAHSECASAAGIWTTANWTRSCPADQVGCTEYQTPAANLRQTGDQYVSAVGTTGYTPTISGTTTQNPGNAIWQYRFNILDSGNYTLELSTENYNTGTLGDIYATRTISHNLIISTDGVQMASTAAPARPIPQLTTVSLGNLERGSRVVSIEWNNEWCDALGCPTGDSNLQINSVVLSKTAGAGDTYYNLEQGVDTSTCSGAIDPTKGCVAFNDTTNPILSIKGSVVNANAYAPQACQKCSTAADADTSVTCDANSGKCSCNNNAVITNPCDANTILKAKGDRQCAEWLACTLSEKTKDSKGNTVELCKERKVCYKVGPNGEECDRAGYVTAGTNAGQENQTFNDPVRVTALPPLEGSVQEINLRSGFFKAGIQWTKQCSGAPAGRSCQVNSDCGGGQTCDDRVGAVEEGYFPYSSFEGAPLGGGMQQIGSLYDIPTTPQIETIIAFEDDFETYQSGKPLPQCSVDASACPSLPATCESLNKGSCLDYWSTTAPVEVKATNKEYKFGGQSLLVTRDNDATNRIVSKNIDVQNGGPYVLSVWLNTKDVTPGTPGVGYVPDKLIVEVIGGGTSLATVIQDEGKEWTHYIVPLTTPAPPPAVSTINVRIYLEAGSDIITAGSKGYVDMVSLAPVLLIQNPVDTKTLPANYSTVYNPGDPSAVPPILPTGTLSAYTDRSCRLFAKTDALACKYRERGTSRDIQGWRGYCVETDPKNPDYCLQWWPIDLISGEDLSKY